MTEVPETSLKGGRAAVSITPRAPFTYDKMWMAPPGHSPQGEVKMRKASLGVSHLTHTVFFCVYDDTFV